jgi:hypothetical protein
VSEDRSEDSESGRRTYEIDPGAVAAPTDSDSLTDPTERAESGDPQTPESGAPQEAESGDPEDADIDTTDLPIEVKREFLVQVLLLNLGLLAIAVGAMLLYFRWWLDLGGGLIVIGLVAILLTYRRYVDRPTVD